MFGGGETIFFLFVLFFSVWQQKDVSEVLWVTVAGCVGLKVRKALTANAAVKDILSDMLQTVSDICARRLRSTSVSFSFEFTFSF